MARESKARISYFSLDSDFVTNKKIKLLFTEFGTDGFWVWMCLLSKIYNEEGYYCQFVEKDELILFATDVCKMQVALVDEIIKGCVRRGLFDKTVFNVFNVLTSDRIQNNFIMATKERRRKGIKVFLQEEYLVIDVSEEEINLKICKKNKNEIILPRRNANSSAEECQFLQGGMQQSKVDLKEKEFKDCSSCFKDLNNTKEQTNQNNDNDNLFSGKEEKKSGKNPNYENKDEVKEAITSLFQLFCSKLAPHFSEIDALTQELYQDARFRPSTAFNITQEAFQKFPSLSKEKQNTGYLLGMIKGIKQDRYDKALKERKAREEKEERTRIRGR